MYIHIHISTYVYNVSHVCAVWSSWQAPPPALPPPPHVYIYIYVSIYAYV